MRFEKWGITIWLAIAQIAGSAALLGTLGGAEDGIRIWIRVTAWLSAALFLLAFGARPLRQFWRIDATRALLANRRYVGVSAAFAHLIHGTAIVWLVLAFPQTRELFSPVTVIFGGLGFVFYFAMALTSSNAAVAKLGLASWKRLHTVGGYYVWFIFTFTFFGTVQAEEGPLSLVSALFLFDCLAIWGLRIAARIQKRNDTVPA